MPIGQPGFERWLECREKTCCSHYVVYPTGDEIIALGATLEMALDTLVTPLSSGKAPTAYRLDADDPAFRLALTRTRLTADEAPACGFLMRMHDGAARCGLGVNRPRACKTYPLVYADGELRIDARGCTCGPWRSDQLDGVAAFAQLHAATSAHARYSEVVARWNVDLGMRGPCTHAEFLAYLAGAYGA